MAEATNPITTASNLRVGEDWVLVPREPTPDQLLAYFRTPERVEDHGDLAAQIYREMIASAPSPEAGAGGDLGELERLSAAREAEDEELYRIGKRDGREEAIQDVAGQLGLDDEYRWSTEPDRHQPGPEYMLRNIVEHVSALERDALSYRSGKLVASTGSGEETKGASASPIQIREGAYYASAAGERIGPMHRIPGDAAQVWYARGQKGDWLPDGRALHSSERDNLVAEWFETQEGAR